STRGPGRGWGQGPHRFGPAPGRPGQRRPRRTSCGGIGMSHPHPGLSAPPPLGERALRVVALGGLGEIGRNMAVFEYDGRLLIVDCGVLSPEEEQPGVDLILPDLDHIRDRLDDVEAIMLT